MKRLFTKQFWYGFFMAGMAILLIAAASKQLIGPTSATTANAVAIWTDTTAYKLTNSGVTITSPGTITYDAGVPIMQDMGTIGNAGTLALVSSTNVCYATFSGATATITLPSLSGGVGGTWVLHGTTTYNSGTQIITVPSLIRPEFNPSTAITTFTNASSASGLFTVTFTAINGTFVKFSVVGDNY